MKLNKINKKIILIASIILVSYFIINNNKLKKVKNLFSQDLRYLVKKYIFPYKYIRQLENKLEDSISSKQIDLMDLNKLFEDSRVIDDIQKELIFKKFLQDIQTTKTTKTLSNDLLLEKYNLNEGFYEGISYYAKSGSGFIEFYNNNMLILSSRGVLASSYYNNNQLIFKQIENNIEEFINIEDFRNKTRAHSHHYSISLKDIFIHKNKIYISFTEQIEKNCWNTSIIFGNMNFKKIEFKKFFSSPDKSCIHARKNIDGEFEMLQSGGRITTFDDDHILFSTGEYRSRFLAQDVSNINGKVIKVNIDDASYEIISMGHRNPQGLYFDKKKKFILETEHGPAGGDEVNLIDLTKFKNNKPLNFGWAITSAGEHYNKNIEKNRKYPLFKSHSKHGFIEPLKSFVPSIGISEITKIKSNFYVFSSLKDKSLYFFELENKKMINLNRVEIGERIRDLYFKNNVLFLFLEDTSSIGMIKMDK